MNTGLTFSATRNSITARCLNYTFEEVVIIDYINNKIITLHYRFFTHTMLVQYNLLNA